MQTNMFQAPVAYTQWPNNAEPGRQFLEQILDQADQRVAFHPELPPVLFSNTGNLYTGGFCCRVAGFKRPTREEPKVFNAIIKQRKEITGLRIPVTNFDLHLQSGGRSSAFDLYFPPAVVKIKNRPSQRRRTTGKPATERRIEDLMLRIRIRQRRRGRLPVDATTKVQGNSFQFTFTMPLPTIPQLVQVNHPAPQKAQLSPAGAPAAVARPSIPKPTTCEAMVIEPSLPPAPFALSFLPETATYMSSDHMDTQEPWQNIAPSTSETIGTHEAMLVDPSTSAPTPCTRLTQQGTASASGGATTSHNPKHPAPTAPAPVTSGTQDASFESSSSKATRFSSTSSVGTSYLPPATHFRSTTGAQQQRTGFSRWGGSTTPFSGSTWLATSFLPQANTSTASFNGSAGPTNHSEGSTPTPSEGISQTPITPATVHTGSQYGAGEAAPQEAEDGPEYPSSSDEDGSGDESGAESGDEASEIGDDDGADAHEAEDEDEEEGQDEDVGETNGEDEHHGDAEDEADEDQDQDQENEDPLLSIPPPSSDDDDDDSDAAPGQSAYSTSAGPSTAGRGAPVNLSSRSHSEDASDDGSDDSDTEGPAKPLGLAAKIDLNDMVEDLLEDAKAQGMQRIQERSGSIVEATDWEV